MKTKLIQWDEHNADNRDYTIPVLKGKSYNKEWFYNYCPEYNTYILYHNVEL